MIMSTSPDLATTQLIRAGMLLREHAVTVSEDRDRAKSRGDAAWVMYLGWRWEECIELAGDCEAIAASRLTPAVVPIGLLQAARASASVARAVLRAVAA